MLGRMESDALARWNAWTPEAAAAAILPCCGSRAWANGVAARRPLGSLDDLVRASGEVWRGLDGEDWDEAFASHPRIGERHAAGEVSARASAWSAREQGAAVQSGGSVVAELGEANRRYEKRFGRIFLICASGRSGGEILQQIELRMGNDPETELAVAVEEQRKITELRLQRWLQEAAL